MVRMSNKKHNIIKLIALLKRIKMQRSGGRRSDIANIIRKNMLIRSYYIDGFIKNKKKEMLETQQAIDEMFRKMVVSPFIPSKNEDEYDDDDEDEDEDENKDEDEDENKAKQNINPIIPFEAVNNIPKILVVIACHINNNLRLISLKSIMYFLSRVKNIDIIIVNSTNTPFAGYIKETFQGKILNYFEINNDNYFGFSKWEYGIVNTDIINYEFVTFINDSIILHSDITHFFDYTRFKNVDLYGYNDSSQVDYHYQTYLFSIKVTALHIFIKMIRENKKNINSYLETVLNYEVKLPCYFNNKDCFLKIAHLPLHRGKNIYHDNDLLYFKLKKSGLLPISKLKRILKK